MNWLFYCGGTVFFLYYLVIVLHAGITADFSLFWPALGIIFFLTGEGFHRGIWNRMPVWLKTAGMAFIICALLTALYCLILIISGMKREPEGRVDYVVVLGAQVKGEKPSRALRYRLERAAAFAKEHPETVLITSGGQGSGELISEALCMKRYLTENGIPAERICMEDRSTSTLENLRFADQLTGCSKKRTGVLSNNFHVSRAVMIARRLGYRNVQGIPAKGDGVMLVHYIVREIFALLNEWRRGTI